MAISISGAANTLVTDQRMPLSVFLSGTFPLAEEPMEVEVTSEDLSYSDTFSVTVVGEALAFNATTIPTVPGGRYSAKVYEVGNPSNFDTFQWYIVTDSFSDSDPADITFIGFEHKEAQRDPSDPQNPPGDWLWPYDQPGTYYDNYEFHDGDYKSVLRFSSDWSHKSPGGFGGDYSLKVGGGVYAPYYPSYSGNTYMSFFLCRGDTSSREVRYIWRPDPFFGAGFIEIDFMSHGSDSLGGYLYLFQDGAVELYDSDSNVWYGSVDPTNGVESEWKWTITFDNPGSIKLEVGGVTIVEGTGNFDNNTGEGLGSMLIALQGDLSADAQYYIDDLLCFPAGTLSSTPKYVLGVSPSSDASVVSTPSSGSIRNAMVNEDGAAFDDGDYVTFTTANSTDLYGIEFPWDGIVWGVVALGKQQSDTTDYQATFRHTLSDGTNTIYGMLKANSIGTADYRTLSSAFDLSPSGETWTGEAVSNLLVGIKTIDMVSSNTRLSWYGIEVLCDELTAAIPEEPEPEPTPAEYTDILVSLNIFNTDLSSLTLDHSGFLWDRRRLEDSLDIKTKYETTFGAEESGIRDGIHFDWFSSGVTAGCKYKQLTNKYVGDYKTWTPVVERGIYNTSYHLKPLFSDYSYTSKFATDILEEDSMYHVLHNDVVYSTIRVAIYKRDKNLINPFWVFSQVEEFDGDIVDGERTTRGLSGWETNGNQRKKQFKVVDNKVYLNGSHYVDRQINSSALPDTYPQFVTEYLGQSTGQGTVLFTQFLPVQPDSVRLWVKFGDQYTELEEIEILDYQTAQVQGYQFDHDLGQFILTGYQAPPAYLTQDLLITDTTVHMKTENLYLDNYPKRGVIQVGTERILYTDRTRTELVDCIRGYDNTSPGTYSSGYPISHVKQGADVVGHLYVEYKAVPRIDYEITNHDLRTANRVGWLDIRPIKNVNTNSLLQIYPGQQNIDHIDLSTTAPLLGGDLYGPIYLGTNTAQLTATVYDSFGLPVDDQFVTIRLLEGAGYLNGIESAYKGLTNSNGQIFADYSIPYESRFVESYPIEISHSGADTLMTLRQIDGQLTPEDVWIFQILKHDKLIGSVGLELSVTDEGSASLPYGQYFYTVDGYLDDSYLGGLVRTEISNVIEWREIVWLEQIFDTTNKTKVYVDAGGAVGPTSIKVFKKDEIIWNPVLLNGVRRILYTYDPSAKHPLTGLLGAYFPVHPDEIDGNVLIFNNKLLPLPDSTDDTNNLGGYVVVTGHEALARAETTDPLTGWLKTSNSLRFSVRIPSFLVGVSNEDGIYVPHGFKLISESFNQGSGLGLPNFITINPAASGINQLNIQLSI